ncbi:MAG: hypothetical protein HC770_09210 [Pseudanabaena sp. CRU_2_10]|nr:hypothetical protein [Pseudanabaena sp. CRU_2_10]
MLTQRQNQTQNQVQTQAIAQANNRPASANLAFVGDPIFWTILALAVLIRVICNRS